MAETYDSIVERITGTVESQKLKFALGSVVFGERIRIGTFKTPAIWIVPENYTPEVRGGNSVQHDIPFNIVALVKENEPEEGLKKAQKLALSFYDVFMADRTLGGIVHDTVPSRIDPAYSMGDQNRIYLAAIRLIFRLQRRE